MEENKSKLSPIKTLEQALSVLSRVQSREGRFFQESLVAKARIYDFIYKGVKEPENTELKSQVIYLEDELKKVIKQRDDLKNRLAEERAKNTLIKT
jgi:hypothetical protein